MVKLNIINSYVLFWKYGWNEVRDRKKNCELIVCE